MSQSTRLMGWSWSRADSRLEGEIESWRETLQSYSVQASAALCDRRVVFLQLQARRRPSPPGSPSLWTANLRIRTPSRHVAGVRVLAAAGSGVDMGARTAAQGAHGPHAIAAARTLAQR